MTVAGLATATIDGLTFPSTFSSGTRDDMALLLHEAWVGPDGLARCCLAGPMGDAARKLFVQDGARLVWTFEAGSHFEAMTKYNEHFGREPYTTDHQWDREPYPEEWLRVQRGA